MIVQCERCQTRFQLDESRLPKRGIRVRCSRCKHAFFLAHPSASAEQAADEVAEEALNAGGAAAPDPTEDLPAPSHLGLSGEDEESDWQFNQDPPQAGDESQPQLPAPAAPATSAEGEQAPGEGPDRDVFGKDFVAPDPPALETREEPSEDAESWDFFSDAALESPAGASASAAVAAPAPGAEDRIPLAVERPAKRTAWPQADAPESWTARLARFATGAGGWVAVAALFAVGASPALLRALRPAPPAVYRQALGTLEARQLRATHLENASGVDLTVVRGELHNLGAASASAGALEVVLLDAQGHALGRPEARAAAGLPLDAATLRETAPAELARLQRSAADALSRTALAPGAALPFSAWFAGLPDGAVRFALERGGPGATDGDSANGSPAGGDSGAVTPQVGPAAPVAAPDGRAAAEGSPEGPAPRISSTTPAASPS